MATLVWFTGCECGPDTGGLGREFTAFSNGGGGLPSVVTTPIRTGTYALKTPRDSFARASPGTYASNPTTFVRCYFRIAANPNNNIIILSAGSSSSVAASRHQIFLNSNGTIGWQFATPSVGPATISGASTVLLGDWNLLEVKYVRDTVVGGVEVFLNGVLQFSTFATNTTTGTSLTVVNLFFGDDNSQPGTNRSGQDIFWDDIAFGFGGYIGAGQSIAVQGKAGTPTYDAFTKNGGATAAENWSETPWSGTKNCTSSTIAQRQTMLVNDAALNAAVGASDTINGALVLGVSKIVTAGNCRVTRRIGGVDTDSATKLQSTVDTMTPQGLDHTMDVFVETRANLASAEIGFVANSTNLLTVEDVWLLVDFVPTPVILNRDEQIPVDMLPLVGPSVLIPVDSRGLNPLSRDEIIPIDSKETFVLRHDALIPIDSEGLDQLNRDEAMPIDALLGGVPRTLDAAIPIDSTGVDPNRLLLIWSVRQPLNTPFTLRWNVVQRGLIAQFQLRWSVRQGITPFTLRWNVVPNLLTPLIENDIQKPFGVITKTP